MSLTPQDVHNKEFGTQRGLRRGYDEDEVDAFLDQVEAELTRLYAELAELRAAAAGTRPAGPAAVPAGGGAEEPASDGAGAADPGTGTAGTGTADPGTTATGSAATGTAGVDRELHRRLGVGLFNRSWELMDRAGRTADDDAELVHTAHASLYHWLQAGAPENAARGEWLCSRVYAVLGRAEPARYHARRVLDICRRHGIGDWDLGYAYEALARADAVGGDPARARQWLAEAHTVARTVAEEDDRTHLLADLDTIRV